MSIYALACPLQHKTVVLSPLLLHKSGTIIHLLLSESHHHLTPSNVTSKLIAMSIADGGLYFIFPKTPPSFLWVSSSVPRALQLQDSKKVTHGEPIETHQRSFERYNPDPYGLLIPKIGGLQPPRQTSIAIISGTGKATDFKFGGCIHRFHANTSQLKILEKGRGWAYPGTVQFL